MAIDQYENIATIAVSESAPGTVTYGELQTGLGLRTKQGMVIDAIHYFIEASVINLMLDESDSINFGITISTGVTNLLLSGDRRIIHSGQLGQANSGAPASAQVLLSPFVFEFMHGIPIAEASIFLGGQGISLASAVSITCRIFFRYVDLTDREILEIAQNFQLVG